MMNFEEYERNHKKTMKELKERLDMCCDFIGTKDVPFDIVKEYIDEAIEIADEMSRMDSLHKKVLLRNLNNETKRMFKELFKMRRAQ